MVIIDYSLPQGEKKDPVSILECFLGYFSLSWDMELCLKGDGPSGFFPCLSRVNWLRDKHTSSSVWRSSNNTNSETRRWGTQRAESWFIRHLVALGMICKPVILMRKKKKWMAVPLKILNHSNVAREIDNGHLNVLEVCCKFNSAKINYRF